MSLPKIKAVVFDLDGTLVDSLTTTFNSLNHALDAFGHRALGPQEFFALFGPSEPVILGKLLGKENAEKAYAIAHAYLDERLQDITVFEQVEEMLRKLETQNIDIAIVTGRGWDTTQTILQHHGWEDRFSIVIANDHAPRPKPYPDGILKAIEHLGHSPHECIYLGDMPGDMKAARAAGALPVGAHWDQLAIENDLIAGGAEYTVETPSGLIDLLLNP